MYKSICETLIIMNAFIWSIKIDFIVILCKSLMQSIREKSDSGGKS